MVWTDDLLAQFLGYAADHAPDLHPLLHFMAYRGSRGGEACGLLDAEIRLAKGEVSIVNQIATHGYQTRQKRPKSDAGNREVIRRQTVAPKSVTQRFRRLVKQAGLPSIRLHDLRHGAATLALDAGIDIKVVSDQLGRFTTTLTRDTYQSVVKRLHHEAATAVADRIKNKQRRTASASWVMG